MATKRKKKFKMAVNPDFMQLTLDMFVRAYLDAALWSSTAYDMPGCDENDDRSFLDHGFSPKNIHPYTLSEMRRDCRLFQRQYGYLYVQAGSRVRGWTGDVTAGHDFWLTRVGSGASFWDGDWEFELPDGRDLGKVLTDAAATFGDFNLYVGADGFVHGD